MIEEPAALARAERERLVALGTEEGAATTRRYFRTGEGEYAEGMVLAGVRMGTVFEHAKRAAGLPLEAVAHLIEDPVHEVRAMALRILDIRARRTRTTEGEREALLRLYLDHHDHIDNWDLVDLAAPTVVGGWLRDHPGALLDRLAASPVVWERRTAAMAALFQVRRGDPHEGLRVALLLLEDPHDMVRKPVGGLVREVGRHHRDLMLDFLEQHAGRMPRVALTYAMEHLEPQQRAHFRAL